MVSVENRIESVGITRSISDRVIAKVWQCFNAYTKSYGLPNTEYVDSEANSEADSEADGKLLIANSIYDITLTSSKHYITIRFKERVYMVSSIEHPDLDIEILYVGPQAIMMLKEESVSAVERLGTHIGNICN